MPIWHGLGNYHFLLQDPFLLSSLMKTLYFVAGCVSLLLANSLVLSDLLATGRFWEVRIHVPPESTRGAMNVIGMLFFSSAFHTGELSPVSAVDCGHASAMGNVLFVVLVAAKLMVESKFTFGVRTYDANILMQYRSEWIQVFAALVITMVIPIAFYLVLQKRVVEGATRCRFLPPRVRQGVA